MISIKHIAASEESRQFPNLQKTLYTYSKFDLHDYITLQVTVQHAIHITAQAEQKAMCRRTPQASLGLSYCTIKG